MRTSGILAAVIAAGCATTTSPDPGLEGVALTQVAPGTVIPGTSLQLSGASFVDASWGTATLHLHGDSIDVRWPATFVDFGTMTVAIDPTMIAQTGVTDFHGTATVEIVSSIDSQTYATAALPVDLSFRQTLAPAPSTVETGGVQFVNDAIEVDGDGFLLGGGEGVTVARVTGCFALDASAGGDGTCAPVASQDLPMTPSAALTRTQATFPLAPAIVGIQPGTFTGQVQVVNRQAGDAEVAAAAMPVSYTVVTSQIFQVSPGAASLGQFVFVDGGGFVGGTDGSGAVTEIELVGSFAKTGGDPVQVDMTLIPEYVDGRRVRYVLNTDDALGKSLDLTTDTGSFTGTITPIVSYGAQTVTGVASPAAFQIAPVKQVVYLDFQTSYTEELRDFGLRAVDAQVRAQIVATCQAAYRGVNLEFRTDPVTDFALFSDVELVGVDPNNMGLFGYDNSPGKDVGNARLYDELGGVNAATQQDGFPGYGGIFVRSFMAFSQHPLFGDSDPGADATFDAVFDPLREDRGGTAVTSEDLVGGLPVVDGSACPAADGDRGTAVACGVYVMGNLIGDTLAHEVGHSLGLANPYGDGFHDVGDAPNRLMDAGGQRPFKERATLGGQGPGVFCDDEYAYLKAILPSASGDGGVMRPACSTP
jgi:hypothetical protein|nr:hypothetical protein [Kofleriaceae bacterium]